MAQSPEQREVMTYYVGKNVEISADVVVASGVVLEAATGCRLIIESGVCIGTGVVIQVYGGDLRLASGVSLGKEVLLVGSGTLEECVCVGAESTLVNPRIEANHVVAARSLIQDNQSVQPAATPTAAQSKAIHENGSASPTDEFGQPDPSDSPAENDVEAQPNGTYVDAKLVFGREQVMQLVKTLFPHRDALNVSNDSS